jgi:uncharacterized protein (TIGR02231 family)
MRPSAILAAIVLALPTQAIAAEIAAPSKIDSVTVFPAGAEVTRAIKVKLEAGEHTLLVDGITGRANLSSIRIETAAGDKLEIGSVDAKSVELASTDPAVAQSARKRLEDQLDALNDERAAEDDVIESAKAQQAYLENLGKLPQMPAGAGGSAPKEDWQAVNGIIGSGMNEAAKTIAAAKRKQRSLDRSIADLRLQIEAAGGKVENRAQVRIFVNAPAAIETELKLRYQVEGASWTAFYDAKLATGDQSAGGSPSLAIIRRASIQQQSGEDWQDVTLALSTTRPGRATSMRQLEVLNVDFAAPNAPATSLYDSPIGPLRADFSSVSKSDFDRTRTSAAAAAPGAEAGSLQTVYAIPGRISISDAGEAKRVQLGTEKLDPSLLVLTAPRFEATAYLYARLTLPKTSQPMLAGSVALFRDGVFTGNGRMPQLAPGEEYELGFGADELVKVKQAVVEDKKGQTGTFTTSQLEEHHYAVAVRNLHAQPIKVHILDRIPVSKQQEINVDFSMDKGPLPSATDVNGRRGVMLWVMKTAPDEEAQIAFGYRVTSPKDKPVTYGERSQSSPAAATGVSLGAPMPEGVVDTFRFGATTRF